MRNTSRARVRRQLQTRNLHFAVHCMNDPQAEGHMASHIGRRKFLATLGGAAAAWPLAAQAQPSGRMRRIGVLMHLASDDADAQSRNAAFLQGLQELGWAVGRNVRIDYRWGASNFDPERMRKGAVELVAPHRLRGRH